MSALLLIPAGAAVMLAVAGLIFWVFVDRWLDDVRALDDG